MGWRPKLKRFTLLQLISCGVGIAAFGAVYAETPHIFAYALGAGYHGLLGLWALLHLVRVPFRR